MRAIVLDGAGSMPVLLLAGGAAQAPMKPGRRRAGRGFQRKRPQLAADADADAVQAAAEEDEEIRIPPGFRVKKRGEFTLYCRKEDVMGTRFPSERCYDETGIREYLRAQREDQQKVDQMRRICSSVGSCGSS